MSDTNVPAVEEKPEPEILPNKSVPADALPITPEILNTAKNALSLAVGCLLSPPGSYGRSGDKAFYANFLMRMNLIWTNKMPTAGVSVTDRINFYVNPHFLLKLNIAEQMELIIHEIEHIVYLHPMRSKKLGLNNKDHRLFNIACDANINIPLTELTKNLGVTIERLNDQLKEMGSKYRIDAKDHAEVHYEKLKLIQQEQKVKSPDGMGEDGESDDHSAWEESIENEELAKAVVKEATNKAANATGAGNMPSHMAKELAEMNKSVVNWQRELQQFNMRTLKFERERSRAKRNRRTGILFSGAKRKPKVKLIIIGDESGSMSDKSVAQIFAEIDKVHSMGVEVLYIAMDTQVSNVVQYKKGMKMKRTSCGGTYYTSGIEAAKALKPDAIILIGDGDSSDTPVDPKIPFLWCIVGSQKAPGNFGKTIHILEKE